MNFNGSIFPLIHSLSTQCGMGVLHRGRQMHKALPTVCGDRVNLIIWMRSSVVRNHVSQILIPFLNKIYSSTLDQ